MRPPIQRFLFYSFTAILIMRLIMVFTMGMMPQDAYYYFYSEHLSLSYFDHPPGVAVMLWLFTKALGTEIWGLKLTDFLVTGLSLWMLFILARRFLPKERSRNTVIVFGSTLMVTNLSIVATPDVPLLLCWTLALLAIWHALQHRGILPWIGAGLISGLAFDCKYTGLYLPIALLAFLIFSKHYRSALLSWQYPVYLLCFALAILPVVLWNAEHQFASFQFQSGERVESMMEFRLRPVFFLGVLGHQIFLLLPTFAFTIAIVFWKIFRKMWKAKKLPDDSTLFLLMFSVPFILAFLSISWIYWVKINWMIPAYVAASILALRYMHTKWMKWHLGISIVVNAALLVQILFYPVNIQSDDTYWGWGKLAHEVTALKKTYPDHFVFSRDGYKTTAILNYYLDEKVYAANVIGEHALEYSIVDHDLSSLRGKNALFIDSRKLTDDENGYVPLESVTSSFENVRILTPIILVDKNGKPLRKFAVVECVGFRR